MEEENKCLICGDMVIRKCRCLRGDSYCINGHSYHYSPEYNEYHTGESNHGESECCERKERINNEQTNH